ncbi:hypothetical protein NEOLEDRAFT_1156520 [Neolentinus lepideus HHB14362 ss-1]|uniref:Uncharacterized protein n=1 Tax=Neolentinus lepideus HHB14362 ss-1 TaxID=1314782 RepID=A0A165SEI3_9AGAM|nr:hypothetical protein NEOLEDRAFT_1156520 [Neolentinus lepideus HHB14362 ss-1]
MPGTDQDEADRPDSVPKAFLEEPHVRIAYLEACLANIYGNATVKQATAQLNGTLDSLYIAGALPLLPRPVRSLISAKRRLGLDADQHIMEYALCTACWKHYTPKEMLALPSEHCVLPDCSGEVWETLNDSKNKPYRHAIKIMTHTSIIDTLRRFLMRPGFAQMIRDSRNIIPNRNDDENFLMEDISDGSIWNMSKTRIQRKTGSRGTVRDVPIEGGGQNLNSHRFGLHLTLNSDWFGMLERPHSTGPIYYCINDLPIRERFLQRNIICACIMPGPKEPTALQLNHCLEPSTREISALKNGVEMQIYGQEPQMVFADEIINNCDTPGARKTCGFASHTHGMQPCPWCDITMADIHRPSGYTPENFVRKDDFQLLRQSFLSKDAPPRRQDHILDNYGIRWCTKNLLAGWLPSTRCALDFMHNIFLGVIAHLFTQVLFSGYMFSGAGGRSSQKQRFEDLVNSVRWPSHVTRLPKNLGENQSLKKADEWRRLLHITPILLWWTWKDSSDQIPNRAPPLPSNVKRKPTHSRNCIRILASRTISMAEARLGHDFLVQYCKHCLRLGIHLVINHHLAMHYVDMIKLFGPIYGWWLFAFERLNGMFEKVNHNGHDGGRMELTLMRNWVQTQLLYELLLGLPPSAHDLERRLLHRYILSEASSRGSMMTQIAIAASEQVIQNVQLPRRPLSKVKPLDLRGHSNSECNLYQLLWPDLALVDDMSSAPGTAFIASRADGIRYGCMASTRSKTDKYAFIRTADGTSRIPVQIGWLFVIQAGDKEPHVCAIIPEFPWDLYASTLGIYVTYAETFADYEVISMDRVNAPMALIPIFSRLIEQELFVCISFDHTIHILQHSQQGTEPDDFDEEDYEI